MIANLEDPDPEWQQHNPKGFVYGNGSGKVGGEHMREAGVAEPTTAPNEHFVNAYATSSLAEDKAEIWACLMCYRHALEHSKPLLAKAELLKKRVATLCPLLDSTWWDFVTWHQGIEMKEWEEMPMWPWKLYHNFVTRQKITKEKPEPRHALGDAAAGVRALLAHLKLERYADRFIAEQVDDFGLIRGYESEDRLRFLREELGMEAADATTLSRALEDLLSPVG